MRYLRATVTFGLLAASLLPATPAAGSAAALEDRIAFSRAGDVFTVRPDGSGIRRVTDRPADESAVWSPDGRRLAVTRQNCDIDTCRTSIAVMRPNGSDVVRVSRRIRGSVAALAWSPDGSEIAFVDMDIDNPDAPFPYSAAIKVARADGSGQSRLTGWGWNESPSWSADGSQIAFHSYRDGDAEIYLMGRDGSGLQRVTDNEIDDLSPSWHPDGTRIAFMTLVPPEDEEIPRFYSGISVMRADGDDVVEVVPPLAQNRLISWSPDGNSILFAKVLFSETESYEGLMITPVSEFAESEIMAGWFYTASWSPDGSMLALERNGDIYVAPAAGGTPVRITKGPAYDGNPDWRPPS